MILTTLSEIKKFFLTNAEPEEYPGVEWVHELIAPYRKFIITSAMTFYVNDKKIVITYEFHARDNLYAIVKKVFNQNGETESLEIKYILPKIMIKSAIKKHFPKIFVRSKCSTLSCLQKKVLRNSIERWRLHTFRLDGPVYTRMMIVAQNEFVSIVEAVKAKKEEEAEKKKREAIAEKYLCLL